MNDFLDLLADNRSPAGIAVTTAAIIGVALILRVILVPIVGRRHREDDYRRYWAGPNGRPDRPGRGTMTPEPRGVVQPVAPEPGRHPRRPRTRLNES